MKGENNITRSAMMIQMAVAVMFLLCYAIPGHAGILISDDTGTQGKGKSQLELFGEYSHDKEHGVKEEVTEASATFTFGLTDHLDLVVSLPWQHIRTDDNGWVTKDDGISDLTIEAKWRFLEKENWSFALKPGISLPTGNEDDCLGTGKTGYSLLFITTYNAGEEKFAPEGRKPESEEEKAAHPVEWVVHFNAGYTRNENSVGERKDLWFVSAAGLLEFMEDYFLVADIGTETNTDCKSATHPAYFLAGFIYSFHEIIDIGLGVKLGLNNEEADYALRGGLTFRF
jgi:hypothetical protein